MYVFGYSWICNYAVEDGQVPVVGVPDRCGVRDMMCLYMEPDLLYGNHNTWGGAPVKHAPRM